MCSHLSKPGSSVLWLHHVTCLCINGIRPVI
uniref:Uncharacterized protein n=1 Tax=Rhizophora mucronata TaxID=61149 RepID=A0A2P2PAR4_RHIMU